MALGALPPPEEKRTAVQSMFDRIAPRYDLMNRLITFGLDQRWRRAALTAVNVGAGDVVLDLACGTGDLTELAAARGATVIAADFSGEMLRAARARAGQRGFDSVFVQADGAALPLPDGVISVATCGFALRNFVALPEIFAELARVLAPGGRFAFVEVDRPSNPLVRAGHSFHFDRIVPFVGGLLSDRDAYAYLPQSTVYLPPERELLEMLRRAGFEQVRKARYLLGAVQVLTGIRSKVR